MTTPDLDAIRARAEAATEGPWEAEALEGNIVTPTQGTIVEVYSWTDADAEFIAHAREDVPALLAEVEQLRAELAHARMDRAEQADEAQRARDHLAGLDRIAKVTPCTCSAQRARANRAEATIARVRALVADTGNTSTGPTYALCADVLAAIERTDS